MLKLKNLMGSSQTTTPGALTAEAKRDAILHWVKSSVNKNQLALCRDLAIEHFETRETREDLKMEVLIAIDEKEIMM